MEAPEYSDFAAVGFAFCSIAYWSGGIISHLRVYCSGEEFRFEYARLKKAKISLLGSGLSGLGVTMFAGRLPRSESELDVPIVQIDVQEMNRAAWRNQREFQYSSRRFAQKHTEMIVAERAR